MAKKHKSNYADNLCTPKRSYKVLHLSEKGKVYDLISLEKIYARVAKIYGENKSSLCEIEKKEKKCSFAVIPQTAKVIATRHDMCLVKMEKASNLW